MMGWSYLYAHWFWYLMGCAYCKACSLTRIGLVNVWMFAGESLWDVFFFLDERDVVMRVTNRGTAV
jgi:hypothetical protein